ncbi:MAG: hypothetical protein AUJ96_20390 [Armatimonadetes bacterium CG2_30_66_41]|nr:MAG: hypothetical protein AUJ96_20390 [Armatimonadetes bacterium CG2_30_66_41]
MTVCFVGQVLGAFEQAPAGVLQHRFVAFGLQPPSLRPPDFVQGLVHLLHDMEAIQHMYRLRKPRGDHVEVRLPHVA